MVWYFLSNVAISFEHRATTQAQSFVWQASSYFWQAQRYFWQAQSDSLRGHCEAGSLTGAVHLSHDNAGVLRPAHVDQKGKSWLDLSLQYGAMSRNQLND